MPSDAEHTLENDSREDGGQNKKSPAEKESLTKRRTKTGCLTCRKRRIKCGEERPICKNCIKSKRECAGYSQPLIYKQHGQAISQPISGLLSTNDLFWTDGKSNDANASLNHSDSVRSFVQPRQAAIEGYPRNGIPVWNAASNTQLNAKRQASDRRPSGFASDHDNLSQRSLTAPTAPEAIFAGVDDAAESSSDVTTASHVASTTKDGSVSANPRGQPQNVPVTPIFALNRYSRLGFVQKPSFATGMLPQMGAFHSEQDGSSFKTGDNDPDEPWDVQLDGREMSSIEYPYKKPGGLSDQPSVRLIFDSGTERPARSGALLAKWNRPTSSPLLDERSQEVFKHFISITGPCMGTFDRHDSLSSPGTILKMIWTYALPNMAFQCPALAHAILAVSAIHMFKLNLGSENVAVKHFTHALRRVGAILGDRNQRLEVSTLATVLLLGYYEVMAGDHSRWNLHLSGAGKLVMEHNYAGMMRTVRRMRARAKFNIAQPRTQSRSVSNEERSRVIDPLSQLFDDQEWQVDQKLISRLMGCEVNYDTQVQLNFRLEPELPDFNQKSLDDWRTLVELYWWYCRQDVFMSMLSGDRLLLSYPQWKWCPPRGPLDNASNAHTTLDHLWLILARLADFGGKDRKRKQRVVNAQGGHWIPAPGFLNPATSQSSKKSQQAVGEAHRDMRPSANEGRARTSRQGSGQPSKQPPFYGMIPPVNGEIEMSSSFKMMNAELESGHPQLPVDASSPDGQDLEAQTRHALSEHASITEAFDLFESCLGPDYQPLLSSDIQITTPFGTALQYKTPIIATMWTFFLAGRILLRRLHPHSPPAAMVSASVNSHVTHHLAQMSGRICGGLFAQHNYLLQAGHVDTVLSAAVMETAFSLLFAAVQFQDPVQRGWTISKLSEIAQVTGWQTAAAVAGACESMWEKAGMAGKGPPYHRTMDQSNRDARLNGKHSYGQTRSSNAKPMSAAEEHELRFVSHDRNLIDKHASTRAHWALGLLSVEEDLQRITINDKE